MESFWDENWEPVDGFPGYWVSDFGRVKGPYKMLTPVRNNRGYYAVTLYRNRKRHRWLVHRLVAFAFLGAPPEGKGHVHHWDRDPSNNHLDNLAWTSREENNSHRIWTEQHKPRHKKEAKPASPQKPRNHYRTLADLDPWAVAERNMIDTELKACRAYAKQNG